MEKLTIAELFAAYPYVADFFDVNGLVVEDKHQTIPEYIDKKYAVGSLLILFGRDSNR